MNATTYLLIPLILFALLLYPLIRKAVSLLEIFVQKYIQNSSEKLASSPNDTPNTTLHTVLNLKLLAYERIVLFIERMKPDSLIPRTLSPSFSFQEYQLLLINEIRKEFEYNLSQQLYLSENAWQATVSFKDNIITLINSAATNCQPNCKTGEFAKKILEHYIASDLKADQILKVIKADIQ